MNQNWNEYELKKIKLHKTTVEQPRARLAATCVFLQLHGRTRHTLFALQLHVAFDCKTNNKQSSNSEIPRACVSTWGASNRSYCRHLVPADPLTITVPSDVSRVANQNSGSWLRFALGAAPPGSRRHLIIRHDVSSVSLKCRVHFLEVPGKSLQSRGFLAETNKSDPSGSERIAISACSPHERCCRPERPMKAWLDKS